MYGIGDPSKVGSNFENLAIKAIQTFQKYTGFKIQGLIAGEIGAESLAALSASYLNLQLLDSDLVGGRAAPEIQMDTFSVHNYFITPIFGLSSKNERNIFLEGKIKAIEIEKVFRSFLETKYGSGIIVGYALPISEYKKIAAPNTISETLKIGGYLLQKDINILLEHLQGKFFSTTITKIKLKSRDGFFEGWIQFENEMKLWIKNENIALYKKNILLKKAPDLIFLLNKNFEPLHNTQLNNQGDQEVHILTAEAKYYWKEKNAKKLWESALPKKNK